MALRHLTNLFGDRLHTLPLLVLYLTDGCNSRCATCDIWRNARRNMDMALVDQLAKAAVQLGARWVVLSGGEATQHPQWDEIGRRFRERGLYVMLLTNALLLERQIARTATAVDEVIVSLDAGTPQTYERIRGVDGYERVLAGVRAARDAGLLVTTRTTVQRGNYAEIPAIIEAGLAADVNVISFLTVDVSSSFAFGDRLALHDDSQQLTDADIVAFEAVLDRVEQDHADAFAAGRLAESPAKLRRMVGYFRALRGDNPYTPPRCNAPHISTVIEVDGRVRPCYFLPEIGKIGPMTLPEVLNSSAGIAMRRAYRTGERPECARCVCPLYKGPRSLARL